jgi:hypothetical protein
VFTQHWWNWHVSQPDTSTDPHPNANAGAHINSCAKVGFYSPLIPINVWTAQDNIPVSIYLLHRFGPSKNMSKPKKEKTMASTSS